MAIGDHSVASDANSVAIGYKSQSAPATSVNSASVATTSITSGAPIATHTYGGFAGVGSAAKGSVSVGQVGQERQIKKCSRRRNLCYIYRCCQWQSIVLCS